MPVDVLTMKAWVGLCLLMGVMRLPSRHDYWRKTRQLLVTHFGTVMSRNRFDQIWRYLHLSDNETRDATDKLYKIRWFIEFLNSSFMDVYCPYGNFVVKKGKGSFYIAQYPVRWTAQSALHFLPSLADLFMPTPTRLLREAF